MRLHEYQSKLIFTRYHIPVPKGRVITCAAEARPVAEELGGRVVVKSQVLVGGRGKAGGIRLAKNSEEAEELATLILRMEIKGLPVRKLLIEEAVGISKEIYIGITNDRDLKRPVMIASPEGGTNIEEVAYHNPEKIVKVVIDPLLGLRDYQIRDIAIGIDLPREYWRRFMVIADALWRIYMDCDATLVEVNPLVLTEENQIVALDGKIILDDNALFRHDDLSDMRDLDVEEHAEEEARKYGLSYIKLDGMIGCMVNGAGLAMATMDIIKYCGETPANFLDIGGGANAEKVSTAFRIIMADPNVKVILVNIFGGITRCDEVARGILTAISENKPSVPIVVRLAGTNAEKGLQLLTNANILTADTLLGAAQKAVSLVRGD